MSTQASCNGEEKGEEKGTPTGASKEFLRIDIDDRSDV
jgi:hypothetical protein